MTNTILDLDLLQRLQEKPAPFTPGEPLFWDDPHISAQMLATHLDPNNDLASRVPAMIERTVAWITQAAGLQAGQALLDLGCGPGLYATRLARLGLRVSGVDYSRRSIAYARETAQAEELAIDYRYMNYLELQDENLYDAALLIYGDLCPLSPEQRARLLANVRRALKPGGAFVLDVSTRALRTRHGARNGWYAAGSGFWKAGPHLVLEQGFDYPEQAIFLNQYVVVEPDGKVTVYRNWFQDYSPESITAELAQAGFAVQALWGDLAGAPLREDSDWIGVLARSG